MAKARIRLRGIRRILFGVFLMLATSAAQSQTPRENTTLSIEIAFPHEVSCRSFDSQADNGRAFWRLCESKQDDVNAVMQTGLFPLGSIDADPALARSVAQTMVDAATVRLVDGKWDRLAGIDYQGGVGFEAIGHRLDGRIHRLLSITKGRRIFYITGVAPEGRPEIDQFFNSVRLE